MNWTLLLSPPNLLTLSRLPLAAVFLAMEDARTRLILVALAALTDVLDGFLARRFDWRSDLGQLLDPVADKTFVLAALSAFVLDGTLSTAAYLIVLSRDFATAIGFLVAWRLPGLDPANFRARWPGKMVTGLQLAILVALLLRPEWLTLLVPVIGVASAVAIVDYTLVLHRTRGAS